jgi:hypothetical protein
MRRKQQHAREKCLDNEGGDLMPYQPGIELNMDAGHSIGRSMIRAIAMSVLISLLSWGGGGFHGWTAEGNGSKLTIVSPAQGSVIKGDSVEVRYKLSKGMDATHIHCYVDGEYQKGFKGVVKGLTRGSHEIKLVAASHDHNALDAEATVTIEVE